MPCTYQTFARQNLLAKRYYGDLETRCVLKLLDAIELDPSYIEGMCEIDDLRTIESFAIPEGDIGGLADLIQGIHQRRRQPRLKAVVTCREDVRAAAKYYAHQVENLPAVRVGIFDTIAEAMRFLGIDDPELVANLHFGTRNVAH